MEGLFYHTLLKNITLENGKEFNIRNYRFYNSIEIRIIIPNIIFDVIDKEKDTYLLIMILTECWY